MARYFTAASLEYLIRDNPAVISPPFSMACWLYSVVGVGTRCLMCINEKDVGFFRGHYLVLNGNDVGDPIGASTSANNDWATAKTTTGITTSTWHHACGVWADVDDRRSYIDGGSKATDVTSRTPASVDQTMIGAVKYGAFGDWYWDGAIAEAAIWDVDLTDAEVAVLATGIRPIMVRPQNIVAYWPLVRDQDYDLVGWYAMTPINTPTIFPHPPIIYGATPGLFGVAGAGPGPPIGVALSGLSGLSGLSAIMRGG